MIKYYLEGTEDILNEYSKNDKEFILQTASSIRINRLRKVGKKIFNGLANKLDCTISKAVKGVNSVLVFYFKNLPNGFKRPNNTYEIVNEEGVCLRFNRRIATANVGIKGYLQITRNYIKVKPYDKTCDTTTLHRLVALAFIPNPNNLKTINHIDGNKLNNNVKNLEWLSNEDNIKHGWENNLFDTEKLSLAARGENNSQAKITQKDVDFIRSTYTELRTRFKERIAKDFNVDTNTIEQILLGNNYNLPRYRVKIMQKTSRGAGHFEKLVYCCKSNLGTDGFIRGKWIKEYKDFQQRVVNVLDISKATVRDIVADRSWNK